MLNKLFGSKARVKILKIFLTKPDEKFYIRQLARDLKLQVNSVKRELENLEAFGLLSSAENREGEEAPAEREDFLVQTIEDLKAQKDKKTVKAKKSQAKSDKKYFRVNKDFVLYEEIRSLILRAQILYEKDFLEKLYRIGSPKLIILTGFFVNDEKRQIDILVVGRFNKSKFSKVIKDLEQEVGREINYSVMNVQEYKYRKDITDIFVYDILENKNITLINEI